MKLAAIALIAFAAAACVQQQPKWHEARQSPAAPEPVMLDLLGTDASTVEELRRAGRRAVCRFAPIRPDDPDAGRPPADAYRDRLTLCRDKGFDAVTLDTPLSPELTRHAADLELTVFPAPSGSAGRKTTNGW